MLKFTYTTSAFQNAAGLRIVYRQIRANPERARLLIIHGLGEHSNRYHNVTELCLQNGISVWALDLRGHGLSHGQRGDIDRFDDYHDDVQGVMDCSFREQSGPVKHFILGHSMGGLVALRYAIRYPNGLSGLIVSSPSLGVTENIDGIKGTLVRWLARIWPACRLTNGLDTNKLSHDPEVVKAYEQDPLVHNRITPRWVMEFMAAIKTTHYLAPRLLTPTLMQIAGADTIVDPNQSQVFFNHISAEDKTCLIYKESYHEIYNEDEEYRNPVLHDVQHWLEQRIQQD